MIQFTKNTANTIYIPMDRRTFGRNGIALVVDGFRERYIRCCPHPLVVALEKGESYKFFRVLCWGDKDSARKEGIRYIVPDKAGTYSKICLVYPPQELQLSCSL